MYIRLPGPSSTCLYIFIMTTTTMAAAQTDLDTVYISPYEIRRPRGRPKLPDELKTPPKKPMPKIPSERGPGRPKREVPLTAEEIAERRIRYKGDEFKQEYTRLHQKFYYQRPEVKQHKNEYKNKRSAEHEARKSQRII